MTKQRNPLAAWISNHAQEYPTQRDFAIAAGISEGRLSQILSGDCPSVDLCIRIEKLTGGAVPGSYFRPDVWPPAAAAS